MACLSTVDRAVESRGVVVPVAIWQYQRRAGAATINDDRRRRIGNRHSEGWKVWELAAERKESLKEER